MDRLNIFLVGLLVVVTLSSAVCSVHSESKSPSGNLVDTILKMIKDAHVPVYKVDDTIKHRLDGTVELTSLEEFRNKLYSGEVRYILYNCKCPNACVFYLKDKYSTIDYHFAVCGEMVCDLSMYSWFFCTLIEAVIFFAEWSVFLTVIYIALHGALGKRVKA